MDTPQPQPPTPAGRQRAKWTEETRAAFLLALRRSGSVNAAAGAVNVPESVVRWHRNKEPEFAEECDQALAALNEELMGVVREHAVKGMVVRQIKNDAGEVVVQERRYSERLLLAWLKRQESGSWADRVQVDQKVTGKVEHEHSGRIEVEHLTPEQRRKAREFLATLN
jgi:hypothetical protein